MSEHNREQKQKPKKSTEQKNDNIVFYEQKTPIKKDPPQKYSEHHTSGKMKLSSSTVPIKGKALPNSSKKIKKDLNEAKSGNPKYGNKNKKVSSQKFKLTKKRVVLNVICSVLAAVMILTGTGCIFIYTYFNRINYKEREQKPEVSKTSVADVSKNSTAHSSNLPKIDTYNGELLNDPMILNIMLFGADTRKGASTGQSDTMILFSIDTRHKKLKMLSFMRDTYVDIPGYESQKLNASYTFGGASLAVTTIELNYGIQIDRYAVVDFKSFRKIIDTLGGIDLELTDEEIDYIDWQLYVNGQADTRYELDVNDYNFYENENGDYVANVHLTGQQALWHARNRGEDGICSGDDYTRTLRQRNVVGKIISDLKNADFATILAVIYEIGPMITTNLKTSEITSLATNITKYLKYDIVSESAPIADNVGIDFYYSDENNPVIVNGDMIDCIVIYDWNEFRQKIAEFVFEEQVEQTTSSE